MGKRKLLLSGESIAELRKECEEFLRETGGHKTIECRPPPIPPLQGEQLPLNPVTASPQVSDRRLYADPVLAPVPVEPVAIHSIPTGAAVDKRGIPWDARVHSSSKELVKDGSWRKRRGVEDSELHRVEQELLFLGKGTGAGNAPPQVVAHQYPVAPPVPMGNVPAAYPVPVAPVIPSAIPQDPFIATIAPTNLVPFPSTPALPTPSPTQQIVSLAHNAGTFKQNMPLVLAELCKQGRINQEWIAACKQECKVQEIWELTDAQKNELFETLCEYNLITRMP